MKLYLIRHGQTDWNVEGKIQGSTDIPLNETGRRQAECLAKGMEKRPVTKIYASTLSRAFETAEAIGRSQGVEVLQIDGLEEVHYGKWEGLTMKEIEEQYPKELELWYYSPVEVAPPGGETQTEVYERCGRALKTILDENDGDVAIVSHGATLVFIVEYLLSDQRSDDDEDIIVGNASITTIEYDREKGKFTMLELNDTSHLEEL